jgi:hypothetical protein
MIYTKRLHEHDYKLKFVIRINYPLEKLPIRSATIESEMCLSPNFSMFLLHSFFSYRA